MKTFFSVGIGLVIGFVIGFVSSYKAAEAKYSKISEDEISSEREAIAKHFNENSEEKENVCECKNEERPEEDFTDYKEVSSMYDYTILRDYLQSKKPHILEQCDFKAFDEEFLQTDRYEQLLVVFDPAELSAVDEDNNVIEDVEECLGFSNLRELTDNPKYSNGSIMIVNSQLKKLYVVHVGDLNEYEED